MAAVRLLFTDACAETLELLQARHPPPPATLVTTFINEIVRLPRFILVLDDYHTLGGKAVHDLLGQLLGHWPHSLHLVLISRHPPPLPLAELRARGSMVEIRRDDLRFTEAEIGAYLARALDQPLSQPALALLEQRTEGWIAGLHLAALALRDTGDTEAVLNALAAADTNISAYLVDGVLALQPPAIHSFLLQTCILDRFCVPLCEAVIGASECDVPACINWLEDANLFVTALDDRRKWYRYHPLFQNLLQRRALAEWGLEAVADRHRRAAAWFDRQALLDEALRHALAAGDLDYAARLMEQGLCAVLNREDRSTLERWLRLLPEEFIQRRPGLLMVKAWVLQLTWQLGAQMRVLRQVEALLNADAGAVLPADELQILRGQIAGMYAQAAYFSNQPARCIAGCEEALALLPASWTYVRGGIMMYLGLGMQASGQGAAAARWLLDSYESLPDRTSTYAVRLLLAPCLNDLQAGRLEQARQTARVMLQQATIGGLVVNQGWAHYCLGLVHYHWNELDTAGQHFRELIDKRYLIQALTAREGMTGLALVHQALDAGAEAWRMVEMLGQFDLERMGNEEDATRSLRARLLLLQGNVEQAGRWADAFTVPVPDCPLLWLEQPSLTKARILITRAGAAGVQPALELLDALDDIAGRTCNTRVRIEILALRALALDVGGQAEPAAAALRQALDLARPGGFVRVFVDLGPSLQQLLRRLGGQGEEEPAIRRILAAFPEPRSSQGPDNRRTGSEQDSSHRPANGIEPLTRREIEILSLMREGLRDKDIARRLNISHQTVKRHAVNLYVKLSVKRRLDAVAKAETLRILPPR